MEQFRGVFMQQFQTQQALLAGLQTQQFQTQQTLQASVDNQPTQELFTEWFQNIHTASPQTHTEPAEAKPADTKPAEAKPAETVPAETTTQADPADAEAAEPSAVPEANHSDTAPEPEQPIPIEVLNQFQIPTHQLQSSSLTHIPGSVMLQPPTCSITKHQPALGSVMLQPPISGAAAAQPDQRDSARNAEPGQPTMIPISIPATRNCVPATRRWPRAAVQHHQLQRQRHTRPATTETEMSHIADLQQAELAANADASDAGWLVVEAAAEAAEELAGNAAEAAAAAEAPASPESPVAEAAAAPATEVPATEAAAAEAAVAPAAPATAAEVHIAAAAEEALA